MSTTDRGLCTIAGHIDALRREGGLLADAAERAGMRAPVPSCPGWKVRDLLRHTGYVHRWAAGYVNERHIGPVDRWGEEEILRRGPDDDVLLGWFREGHAHLVRTLEDADPGLNCWTFLKAPSPLAFWARRQAHETAIHRVDAEQACAAALGHGGSADAEPGSRSGAGGRSRPGSEDGPAAGGRGKPPWTPFPPRFAADGVDELIMGFMARDPDPASWRAPTGTLAMRAADSGDGAAAAGWTVAPAPDRLVVSRGAGPADCTVTAPAGDLYLLVWNRRLPGGLPVSGNAEVLAAFLHAATVTWR